MKKRYLLTALLLLFYCLPVIAQSFAINTDGSNAHASALLDVKSITKGLLIPRMTLVNRNAIASPATGLMIYQTDNTPGFYYYDGTAWVSITSSGNNLWVQSGADIYNSNTGNVGIGITTPLASLHVKRGAVLFDSPFGATPVSGSGPRMMWIPDKSAFRAGLVSGMDWDDANIGLYSFATGLDTKASEYGSTALGVYTAAPAFFSTAMGYSTIASGSYSTAMGMSTIASGSHSTASGYYTTASGSYSSALGADSWASGTSSTAMGDNSLASGNVSTAIGVSLKSKSFGGFVTGLYNDSTNAANATAINNLNRIFQVGNGMDINTRSNAMTILQNGNTGIGTTTPVALLQVKKGAVLFDSTVGATPVSGAGTRMMWIPAKAAFRAGIVYTTEWDDANIGLYSVATGSGNKASGNYSTALGSISTASGDYSTSIGIFNNVAGQGAMVIGYRNAASGNFAISMGQMNTASGDSSIAMGYLTKTSGTYSTSLGLQAKSKSYGGFVTGMYNDSTNAANSLAADNLNRIFQVGNGTADNARSNAITILQSGNTGIGTVTPQALLHVKSGAVLFDSTIGITPASGTGTRMMWIPAKGAFRAGRVINNRWDDANIGMYSVAMGFNSKASGDYSTGIGIAAIASGDNSIALGSQTTASGSTSTAMGHLTTASGGLSTAMGYITKASGDYSTAMGYITIASGSNSTAIGQYSTASGDLSTASGEFVKSKSFAGFATGLYNDSTNAADALAMNSLNRIFQIGNGTADNARSNAMTVLQNGNTGIGELSPLTHVHISGSGTTNQLILEDSTNNKTIRLSNDGGASGPYIGTSTDHPFSIVTNNTVRAIITNTGTVDVKNNLTVQNGKGIIRNTDGTQSKKLSTTVLVSTSFAAGETKTFTVTWPETFSAAPEAFVGNVTGGAGGWAEVVMTISGTSTTGATLYVYNPKTIGVSPNFNIKVVAIGAQ